MSLTLWETYADFGPLTAMNTIWDDFCDGYSYSFSYISGPYTGGISTDMSTIIVAQDANMPMPTYSATLSDLGWTDIGSVQGTHVL